MVMGVGWAVRGVVGGEVGVWVGIGEVHPLIQSIMIRAVVMSPYMIVFIVCDMKFRYIMLRMKEISWSLPGQVSSLMTGPLRAGNGMRSSVTRASLQGI